MTTSAVLMICGLFALSGVSGMLGLGVAFAAIPFLGFFYTDLVHQVQPLSLLLNGMTALFAVFGFAGSGSMEWRKAGGLAVVTTLAAPLGSWLAQGINQGIVWGVYFAAVLFLAWRLWRPLPEAAAVCEQFRPVVLFAIPIALLSGLLGVGPGFLLVPTLIICGFEAKRAAAINALAVTPPSFSALLPHLGAAHFDPVLTLPLVAAGAAGSYLGAHLSGRYLPGQQVKQIFGILIIIMTGVRLFQLFR